MSDGKTYLYETEVEWTGAKDLKLSGAKQPAIAAGAPPEFQGREENWSPEHLFVASLNSCYVLTLIAIAEFSKVALVASAGDLSCMPRILAKAKDNCFISNSIKATIRVEPEVFHHQTPSTPCPLGDSPG